MRSPHGIEALLKQLRTGPLAGAPEPDPEVFGQPSRAVPSGWPSIDRVTGSTGGAAGLVRGCVHEWFGVGGAGSARAGRSTREWSPPLLLLAHLARRAARDAASRGAPASVIWIGRRVWPYPGAIARQTAVIEGQRAPAMERSAGELEVHLEPGDDAPAEGSPGVASETAPEALAGDSPGDVPGGLLADDPAGVGLIERSIFAAPKDASLRLWTIDTALRCPGITAVVADGSGLGMAATRRLQLAATSSEALVLLARPPGEEREVSAATTRWRVRRRESTCDGPAWSVTLLRAKGAQQLHRSRIAAPRPPQERRRGGADERAPTLSAQLAPTLAPTLAPVPAPAPAPGSRPTER